MTENKRFEELIKFLIDNKYVRNQQEFTEKVGSNKTTVSLIKTGKISIPNDMFLKIKTAFPFVSIEWLKKNDGDMLQFEGERKKIPLYDEASSIGGQNKVANMEGVSGPSDYIDTGDWFKDATAALRHYEDSMLEYPSGCILAIKEVIDRRLIIPGRDYVIETSEYRVTKKLQTVPGAEYFVAHSTNLDTYPNGTRIHPPFEVPSDAVTRIFLVLGYVVNKNGTKIFYNSNK